MQSYLQGFGPCVLSFIRIRVVLVCFWVPFLQVRGELALFVSWTALPAANWAESTLLATLSRLSFAARLAFVLGALSLGSSLARWFTFAFVTTGIASSVCIVIALGKAV